MLVRLSTTRTRKGRTRRIISESTIHTFQQKEGWKSVKEAQRWLEEDFDNTLRLLLLEHGDRLQSIQQDIEADSYEPEEFSVPVPGDPDYFDPPVEALKM